MAKKAAKPKTRGGADFEKFLAYLKPHMAAYPDQKVARRAEISYGFSKDCYDMKPGQAKRIKVRSDRGGDKICLILMTNDQDRALGCDCCDWCWDGSDFVCNLCC